MMKCKAIQGEGRVFTSALVLPRSCKLWIWLSVFGYFSRLFSHETRCLNRNELKWKADLTAVWYMNDSLNLWSRIASAKFPQFLPILRLLHVKQETPRTAHLSGRSAQVFLFNTVMLQGHPFGFTALMPNITNNGNNQENKKYVTCFFLEVKVRCLHLIVPSVNSISGSLWAPF